MNNPTSWKRRLVLVVGLWVAGLVLGSLMFFVVDPQDKGYYVLAVAMFPAGLMVPFMGLIEDRLPEFVYYVLWGGYLAASGWLVWVKNARVFWYGLAGLALVVVLNIGGCAYVIHH